MIIRAALLPALIDCSKRSATLPCRRRRGNRPPFRCYAESVSSTIVKRTFHTVAFTGRKASWTCPAPFSNDSVSVLAV